MRITGNCRFVPTLARVWFVYSWNGHHVKYCIDMHWAGSGLFKYQKYTLMFVGVKMYIRKLCDALRNDITMAYLNYFALMLMFTTPSGAIGQVI